MPVVVGDGPTCGVSVVTALTDDDGEVREKDVVQRAEVTDVSTPGHRWPVFTHGGWSTSSRSGGGWAGDIDAEKVLSLSKPELGGVPCVLCNC